MITSDAGTFIGPILNESDDALDALEREGVLGSNVPPIEITPDAFPYQRRFEMRRRASNLARTGMRDDIPTRVREAVRLHVLAKLPIVRAHPTQVAEDLRLPPELVAEMFADWAKVGWVNETGNERTIDPLGEATLEAWLT